jgi:hypothetical protein
MRIPKDVANLIFPGHDRQKEQERLTDVNNTTPD